MKGAGSESRQECTIRGRVITAHELGVVQRLIAERGGAHRSGLALAVCEQWRWRAANGAWKVRSALGVLQGLESRGWIELPAPDPERRRFARVRMYVSAEPTPENERRLFLRNHPDGQIKYTRSSADEEIPMTCLIRVSIARRPIERCFQEDQSELGLDHCEHRSWRAWHRHVRPVFLARLLLLRLRHRYKKPRP